MCSQPTGATRTVAWFAVFWSPSFPCASACVRASVCLFVCVVRPFRRNRSRSDRCRARFSTHLCASPTGISVSNHRTCVTRSVLSARHGRGGRAYSTAIDRRQRARVSTMATVWCRRDPVVDACRRDGGRVAIGLVRRAAATGVSSFFAS